MILNMLNGMTEVIAARPGDKADLVAATMRTLLAAVGATI